MFPGQRRTEPYCTCYVHCTTKWISNSGESSTHQNTGCEYPGESVTGELEWVFLWVSTLKWNSKCPHLEEMRGLWLAVVSHWDGCNMQHSLCLLWISNQTSSTSDREPTFSTVLIQPGRVLWLVLAIFCTQFYLQSEYIGRRPALMRSRPNYVSRSEEVEANLTKMNQSNESVCLALMSACEPVNERGEQWGVRSEWHSTAPA